MEEEMADSLSPAPLMELTAGLWASKTLAAAVELDLFDLLAGSAGLTAAEIAEARGLDLRPAELLLTGCASLGLLTRQDDRFVSAPIARDYLVRGGRYYFGDYVAMLDRHNYPGWMRLGDAVRRNRPTTWDPDEKPSLFDPDDPTMLETFWAAMYSLSSYTARQLGEAYDFSRVRRLLDVGGGVGAFAIELCWRYADLRATVFDLPFVCDLARARIASAGLADRIACVGGDFFVDERLPEGHDAILLSLVLHDWSETEDLEIVRKCVAALDDGGVVMIAELLLDDDKTGPAPAALMGLAMLVETVGGRNYSGAEYARWLREAGCEEVTVVPFDGLGANAVVVGRKPRALAAR
jgi:predicted O-methyltransferase YrrM